MQQHFPKLPLVLVSRCCWPFMGRKGEGGIDLSSTSGVVTYTSHMEGIGPNYLCPAAPLLPYQHGCLGTNGGGQAWAGNVLNCVGLWLSSSSVWLTKDDGKRGAANVNDCRRCFVFQLVSALQEF